MHDGEKFFPGNTEYFTGPPHIIEEAAVEMTVSGSAAVCFCKKERSLPSPPNRLCAAREDAEAAIKKE